MKWRKARLSNDGRGQDGRNDAGLGGSFAAAGSIHLSVTCPAPSRASRRSRLRPAGQARLRAPAMRCPANTRRPPSRPRSLRAPALMSGAALPNSAATTLGQSPQSSPVSSPKLSSADARIVRPAFGLSASALHGGR